MPGPTSVFAFVVATLMGSLFHVIFGGNARRLAAFLLASWLGFVVGQLAGKSLNIEIYPVGDLHLVPAGMGALFTLFAVLIFTSDRNRPSR
jgi:hypothetical protein